MSSPNKKFPDRIGEPLIVPKGVDVNEFLRRQKASAVGRVTSDPATGIATVNCPYCALYMGTANPIDITAFVDSDGLRDHKVTCSKGHDVKFKSIPQWREERQKLGLQVRN